MILYLYRLTDEDPELQAAIAASMERADDPDVLRAIELSMADSKPSSSSSAVSDVREDVDGMSVRNLKKELEAAGVQIFPGMMRSDLIHMVKEQRGKKNVLGGASRSHDATAVTRNTATKQRVDVDSKAESYDAGARPSALEYYEEDELLAKALRDSLTDM